MIFDISNIFLKKEKGKRQHGRARTVHVVPKGANISSELSFGIFLLTWRVFSDNNNFFPIPNNEPKPKRKKWELEAVTVPLAISSAID